MSRGATRVRIGRNDNHGSSAVAEGRLLPARSNRKTSASIALPLLPLHYQRERQPSDFIEMIETPKVRYRHCYRRKTA